MALSTAEKVLIAGGVIGAVALVAGASSGGRTMAPKQPGTPTPPGPAPRPVPGVNPPGPVPPSPAPPTGSLTPVPGILGVDVSEYQGNINWGTVATQTPVKFQSARCSMGLTKFDSKFKQNWAGMKAAGMRRRIPYHVFIPGQDGIVQANNLHGQVMAAGGLDSIDLPPMLDVETRSVNPGPGAPYRAYLRNMLERAKYLFNRKWLFIYVGGPFWAEQLGPGITKEEKDYFSQYPLWEAAYVKNPDIYIAEPWKSAGKSWTIWQFSGDVNASGGPGLRIPGIQTIVDANVFRGSEQQLDALNFTSLSFF